jgi:hypothetical protein
MTMTMTYVIVALIAFFIWLGKVIPYRTQRLILDVVLDHPAHWRLDRSRWVTSS